MESNPTRMCELLVGLPEVNVRAVHDETDGPLVVHVESRADQGWCRSCGVRASIKDRPAVELVDLLCFGRAPGSVWHKQRWRCRGQACPAGSWTVFDERGAGFVAAVRATWGSTTSASWAWARSRA